MWPIALLSATALSAVAPLPLSFTPNRGQLEAPVQWSARGRDYALFLDGSGVTLALRAARNQCATRPSLRLTLVGATARPLQGLDSLPGVVNSYVGSPDRWREGLPTFGKVKQVGAWPGVDVVYYGSDGRLEMDFVVQPGADLARVALTVDGARARVDKDGALVLSLPGGELRLPAPLVYQLVDGRRRTIAARYRSRGDGRIGFVVGRHDPDRAVVIDPVLVYSSYFGGSGDDVVHAAAVDSSGNLYITGETTSTNLAATNGSSHAVDGGNTDAFVAKIAPSGQSLVFATYLGGNQDDSGHGIAVDAGGNVYVVGSTGSTDFPLKQAYQTTSTGEEVFVTMLTASGALGYSTYLGGAGFDFGSAIAVDSSGAVYVAGSTTADFPGAGTSAGGALFGDAFVSKLGPSPSPTASPLPLIYSKLLGGLDDDYATGIAIDGARSAYVTGATYSNDFPSCSHGPCATPSPTPRPGGGTDVFVTKLTAAGDQLAYSVVFGGTDDQATGGPDEQPAAIAVDTTGAAYIVGQTDATNFPTVNALQPNFAGPSAAQNDAFITKLSADGSAFIYSTYLGGTGDDGAFALALDPSGALYVAGSSDSSNFPVSATAFQTSPFNAGHSGFACQVNASGTALGWSTYFGGTDGASAVNALAADVHGHTYLAGFTAATNLLTRSPLPAPFLGGLDCFLAELGQTGEPPVIASISPPTAPANTNTSVTINGANFVDGATVTFGADSATDAMVTNSDTIVATTPLHAAGPVTVTVTNPDGLDATASFTFDAPTAPTVTAIDPKSGPEAGGTLVTMTGAKFANGATVTFDGAAATTVSIVSSTQITARTPAHAVGAVDVVVANGALTTTLAQGFTYVSTSGDAPTVGAVTPSSGPTSGGTQVAILGNHFFAGATVTIGSSPATNIMLVNNTTLLATTGPGTAGAADVTVTNSDGQSGALKGGFTFGSASNTLTAVAVVPDTGGTAGGDSVLIVGANFADGISLTFGGSAATDLTVKDSNRVMAVTPSHAAGTVDVVLTGADGQTATLAGGFTYASGGGGCSCSFGGGQTVAGVWLLPLMLALLILARRRLKLTSQLPRR